MDGFVGVSFVTCDGKSISANVYVGVCVGGWVGVFEGVLFVTREGKSITINVWVWVGLFVEVS